MLLLSCSKNLLQAQVRSSNPINPSTGEVLKSDTSKVIIPISYLRDANAKLIERIYLIKINAEKDSIINLNKSYIAEQSNIIKNFQGRVLTITEDNNRLRKTINRQKNNNNFLLGTTVVTAIGFVVALFVK